MFCCCVVFVSSRRRHTRCALVTGVQTCALPISSACLRRVQELERSGVIKGYRAVIDPAKLGLTFLAYVTVGLSSHTKKSQAGFEAAMAEAPEVRECHNITGTIEYLLRVETADLASYKHFHTEVLGEIGRASGRERVCQYG